MILGCIGQPSDSLLPMVTAAVGDGSALVLATLGSDGRWMPHPDVIVVLDASQLDASQLSAGQAAAEAPPHVVVVTTRDPAADETQTPRTLGSKSVTVSVSVPADFTSSEPQFSRAGMRFDVHALGTSYPCAVRSVNEAVVLDAVTAVAIAYAVGVDVADVMARLTDVEVGEKWRSELVTRADGVTIVNDAFESDAASMASALKTLTLMTYGSARAVAVLGEMTVDDAESRDEYDRLGRLVVRLNVGKLIVVGYGARHIHNAAGLEGSWDGESVLVESAEEAYDLLENELRDGDVVLVKSSKAAGLGFLGDRLGGKTA